MEVISAHVLGHPLSSVGLERFWWHTLSSGKQQWMQAKNQRVCLVYFLSKLKLKKHVACIYSFERPSKVLSLVLYWPPKWAQLMIHFLLRFTCVSVDMCVLHECIYGPTQTSCGVVASRSCIKSQHIRGTQASLLKEEPALVKQTNGRLFRAL